MAGSSSDSSSNTTYVRKELESLLNEKFFNACLNHEEEKNNEENSFCLDCRFSLCPNCVPYHQSHRIVQLWRYMLKDALRLVEAQKLINCKRIQAYTVNKKKVVYLHPRLPVAENTVRPPQSKCIMCERNLKNPFVYCSIGCKVNHDTNPKGNEKEPDNNSSYVQGGQPKSRSIVQRLYSLGSCSGASSTIATDESSYEGIDPLKGKHSSNSLVSQSRQLLELPSTTGNTTKSHRRKGVPHRSPCF